MQVEGRVVSPGGRRWLVVLWVVGLLGAAVTAWTMLRDRVSERPEIYDVGGTHPGDLTPRLQVDDDVKNYGIDVSIPYHFRTNSLGFRGPEADPDGTPVVVVLGDSFAFGMGTSEGETFPDALRSGLRAHWPRVVVHNAAIPGYTITDELELVRDKVGKLKPDVVLVCHTASDLREMARPTSFRRWVAYDDEDPTRTGDEDVARILREGGGDRGQVSRALYLAKDADVMARVGGVVALTALRSRYVAELLLLRDEIVRQKASAWVGLVLWVGGYGIGDLDAEPVAAAARAAGIAVFDGNRHMLEVPGNLDRLYLPDKHFSATGNRIAGDQTSRWVLEQLRGSR